MDHPVVEGLRQKLSSRSAAAFTKELEERIRQLMADMVDGRLLPKGEANALRASIIELVRSEALPRIGSRSPDDALGVLQKLEAYGFAHLPGERARLELARAQRFPPPPPATWPELAELREAAERHPEACSVRPAVDNSYFAKA